MRVINLTPHEVNLVLPNNETMSYPPSGWVARVETKKMGTSFVEVSTISGETFSVPVTTYKTGKCFVFNGDSKRNFPKPEDGTVFIVSMPCLPALTRRTDVIGIDAPVLDSKGRTIGCRSFKQVG